ncbi:hypothetical protein [Flavobacterium sp. PS2]|uniref:hypothetical protein n=1 Tax=Flavobacterium sp. PS2 TaxID=3384157 RepID=UPI00390CC798
MTVLLLSFFGLLYFVNTKPKNIKPDLNYCHGVVLDENLKPIINVDVSNISKHHSTFTNINGYFQLQLDSTTAPEPLIFNKKDYQIDTVNVVDIAPRGDNYFYRFMYSKPDTIVLRRLKSQ